MARNIVPANHHWKGTRGTQDTSVQSILKVVHKRTYVLVLFSLAVKHIPLLLREVVRSQEAKKLKNIAFVRDFEHFDNEFDFSGLKGWEDIEVDNVKPQGTVSSLLLVTA